MKFQNVNFGYDEVLILKDLNFEIQAGTIVGLIGANGAGKTTTILNMIRNKTPNSGDITINGINIKDISNSEFKVSYIPDNPLYYGELSIYEHLKFINSLYGNKANIDEIIKSFDLKEHINKKPDELSKGTLQKMMISMALIRDYEFLIADEPFNGLDPSQMRNLKDILCDIKGQGKAVLLSTHLLDVVEEFCDKYIIIDHGEIIATGTLKQICRRYNIEENSSVEEVYLKVVKRSQVI